MGLGVGLVLSEKEVVFWWVCFDFFWKSFHISAIADVGC